MQKQQHETAIAVYHTDIVPTLTERQGFVIEWLERCRMWSKRDPTALELLDYVKGFYPSARLDVNSIRPRLTELEMAGRVEKGEKRRCLVSGKVVTTWRLRRPDRLF